MLAEHGYAFTEKEINNIYLNKGDTATFFSSANAVVNILGKVQDECDDKSSKVLNEKKQKFYQALVATGLFRNVMCSDANHVTSVKEGRGMSDAYSFIPVDLSEIY